MTATSQEPAQLITWEADEIRAGVRKIPGYAGHIAGVRHTIGCSYGTGSADVLGNPDCDARKPYPSSILRNRHDGYTAKHHPDHPFSEENFQRTITKKSRIIPGYAGHQPGWQHTYGRTSGNYGSEKYTMFTTLTRRIPTERVKSAPINIFDLPEPPQDKIFRAQLYPMAKGYIPGTTCYAPAMRERFSRGYSPLTREAFEQPVPRIPAPLENPDDGKRIRHLELPAGYAGHNPQVLPEFISKRSDVGLTETS